VGREVELKSLGGQAGRREESNERRKEGKKEGRQE
jgi:hypothetical protein